MVGYWWSGNQTEVDFCCFSKKFYLRNYADFSASDMYMYEIEKVTV